MRGLAVLPLAVAAAVFAALYFGRGYPWQLALLAATAIGAFIHVTRRTITHLRQLNRRRERRLTAHRETAHRPPEMPPR